MTDPSFPIVNPTDNTRVWDPTFNKWSTTRVSPF